MQNVCRVCLVLMVLAPTWAWGQALSRREASLLNPLEYGSTCTSATLNAAISAAPAGGRVIMLTPVDRAGVPCVWAITSHVTVPSPHVLHVPEGASLSISSGIILTLARYPREDNRSWKTGAGTLVIQEPNPVTRRVNVRDSGAVGDGATNDRVAIQAAVTAAVTAGTKTIFFPSGTYFVGTYAVDTHIIDLSGVGEGFTIETEGKVLLTTTTTANVTSSIFYVENASHLHVGPIQFLDHGYNDDLAQLWGAIGFELSNNGGNWGNLIFESIHGQNMVSPISINVSGTPSAVNRIRGVHIKQLFANHTHYGFVAANEGDGVTIDNLVAYLNLRVYFVYGVSSHKVKIFNRQNRGSSGAVLIGRGLNGPNTHGIDVSYTARDMVGPLIHILIYHLDLLGGEISGLKIDVNIHDTNGANYWPVRLVNYTASGGVETTAPSPNIVRDIRLSGSCDGFAFKPQVNASYATKTQMQFITGFNFLPDQTLYDAFLLTQSARSAVGVTWNAATTAPVLGDGALNYSIDIAQGMAHLTVNLVFGASTSPGTGIWSFSGFGVKATVQTYGASLAIDAGGNFHTGVCRILVGTDTVSCFFNNNFSGARSDFPFTWAIGDSLHFTIIFPLT